jgi:hypothetical protein
MKKILVLVLALVLAACAAQPIVPTASATAMLPPIVTLTATPSFTATPTFTPTPALTSDQQLALDATNAALVGVWTIDNSGAVTDANGNAPEGVIYSVERGVLTRTYMYEGKEITVDMPLNIKSPIPEGCVAGFDAKCLTKEGNIAIKTFSSAGGYGYEGDGNPEHEDSLPLYSVEEQHRTLSNPDVVDMVNRDVPQSSMFSNLRVRLDGSSGSPIIREEVTGWFWGDNMIYQPNGDGEFTPLTATPFKITDFVKYPNISVTFYNLKDGTNAIMLSDVSLCGSFEENMTWTEEENIPKKWSEYYTVDRLPGF